MGKATRSERESNVERVAHKTRLIPREMTFVASWRNGPFPSDCHGCSFIGQSKPFLSATPYVPTKFIKPHFAAVVDQHKSIDNVQFPHSVFHRA